MKSSIIGCGWLGLPLGKFLAEQGHELLGSTTSEEKLALIEEAGVQPVLMKLSPMPMGKNFNKLFESELLIVNIPPRRKKNPPEYYMEQIKFLRYLVDNSSVKKIIFISSTSYYPNTNGIVSTETKFDFDKGSSKAVVWGEREVSKTEKELLVLRCGGLMGGNRVPGKWFSGKNIAGRDTPVNYIDRQDILKVISKEIDCGPIDGRKQTKNLVSPFHPTRGEVIEASAKKHEFQLPKWIEPKMLPHKIVASDFNEIGLRSPVDY